jgi:DNA-binding transcriptional MocR family regulator
MDWLPTLSDRQGPVYRRILDALAADVANGRLHRGQQLPTHRALAKALGIDLTTVTRAYTKLDDVASPKHAWDKARLLRKAWRTFDMPLVRETSSTFR